MHDTDDRIPVTVVTGFLGSGKTTLVNHILRSPNVGRLAVIVNEFGEIGIDGDLIQSGDEELIELSSGCICCVVRGDLIRVVRRLIAEQPDLDGIVIETTGLANPSPVIQTFVVDQLIGAACRIDSVVCMVDAAHIFEQLGKWPDAAEQIAFADHVILNKMDATAHPSGDIEGRLATLNPFARISRTNRARVDLSELLGQRSHDLSAIADKLAATQMDEDHQHIDATGIESMSLSYDAPVDADTLETWLEETLARYGNDILRTKGILRVTGKKQPLVIQAVNMMVEGDFRGNWDGKNPHSRIVFIGRKLPRNVLRAGFEKCLSLEYSQE